MTTRVTALLEQARQLTPAEQLDLAKRLEALALDDGEADGTPEEIEAAWLEEVERRAAAFDRGETTSVSMDEAIAFARAQLHKA